MKLVNHTAVPARALVTTSSDPNRRIGMIVAKATFRSEGLAEPRLDTHDPHPVYEDDRSTELGLPPGDLLPRKGAAFEVIVLGTGRNPPERPATHRTIALGVGDVERRLLLYGDRAWESSLGRWTIGDAAPFTSIPLVWERAFGGRCDVWVDRDAKVEVSDPLNQRGHGFDPSPQAELLARALRVRSGYPQVDVDPRMPNLESPQAPISRRSDVPEPCCWATVPRDIGFATIEEIRRRGERRSADRDLAHQRERLALRAHPDWIIALPSAAAPVRMSGIGPDETTAFPLPRLRVLVDYAVEARTGTVELRPQRLVLLPDERRMYVVYCALFATERPRSGERSMRLRLEEGWFSAPAGATT